MSARILTSYYRPKPGGFCKRLFRAIRALLDAGHQVHYLAVVPFPIHHPNCHFHRFPWPASRTDTLLFWAVFHLLAPLILLYLGMRLRITHAFAFGPTYSVLLQPLRCVTRIPLALFLRADTLENHRIKGRAGALIAMERILEAVAISGIDLYGVSETLVKDVVERHRHVRPRIAGVLRNDIPEQALVCAARRVGAPLRVAVVGVLEERKNQGLLLKCMAGFSKGEVHLYLYGTGPARIALERQAEALSLSEKISLMGWVNASEIWPNIDVLLMPSLHEGAPNAVLEALSCGVPVLASDIPEHREILPVSSLVQLGDPCAWVHRIRAILAHPAESLSTLAASQEVAAKALRFDWDEEFRRCVMDGRSPTAAAEAGRH